MTSITIYGAGLIGSGWATHLVCCNFPGVVIYDNSEQQLDKARERISHDLKLLVQGNVLTEDECAQRMKRLIFTTDQETALKDADLIQENCPENLELKKRIMKDIEAGCSKDTMIATSTSGLPVTEITTEMEHPERVVGAHPYHPVYLLPLIELVWGEKTDPDVLERMRKFYLSIRKEPVVLQKECPGYIASRLMSVLFRESVYLIQEGVATMEDVDRAFTYGPGMRYGLLGINMTLQLTGGENGIAGAVFGDIGKASGSWMKTFANFAEWPDDYEPFWDTIQEQMNEEMSHRDVSHGRTNKEIEEFRDRGLIRLLQYHGKL